MNNTNAASKLSYLLNYWTGWWTTNESTLENICYSLRMWLHTRANRRPWVSSYAAAIGIYSSASTVHEHQEHWRYTIPKAFLDESLWNLDRFFWEQPSTQSNAEDASLRFSFISSSKLLSKQKNISYLISYHPDFIREDRYQTSVDGSEQERKAKQATSNTYWRRLVDTLATLEALEIVLQVPTAEWRTTKTPKKSENIQNSF